MRHVDLERLTLIAIGDLTETFEDTDHLRECPVCTRELRALRDVAALGRETRHERHLRSPSESVWERIAAETGQGGEPAATPPPVVPSPARRRPGPRLLAVAAAAAVLGAGGAVAVNLATMPRPPSEPAEQVIARADLDRLPSAPQSADGEARVVRTGDRVVLRLSMDGMPAPEGLYQIWLYDGADTMIPLGVLTGGQADVAVPDSIDLADYPIVDVSAQRLGQQEHGVSMLQGNLM